MTNRQVVGDYKVSVLILMMVNPLRFPKDLLLRKEVLLEIKTFKKSIFILKIELLLYLK